MLQLGPLKLNAYGAMIALGVVAAVWLSGRRLEKRGAGTREDMSAIALWGVPAGVIGGRLYHVITDWELFSGHPERIIQIWKGGLGIWGGIFLGVIVGIWEGRRRGISTAVLLTCVAPALPLAQSIGRWGNWFNQELFGRPTTLPWGLEVSEFHTRQAGFPVGTLFHPTFLYESLACLALCGMLLLLDKVVKRASSAQNKDLAEVRTAVALTPEQESRLAAALEKATGKKVNLKVVVDPSVLGGVVATVGDSVIDGSVRTRLDQVKSRL